MVKKTTVSNPSEFSGFAAFANHTSTASVALQLTRRTSSSSLTSNVSATRSPTSPSTTNMNQLRPSPVYLGSDSKMAVLFKRIGQKRDAITKIRALGELSSYAFPVSTTTIPSVESTNSPTGPSITTTLYTVMTPPEEVKKSDQISALSHFFFLFQTKLIHDNNPNVRYGALKLIGDACVHAPKAFLTLLFYEETSLNVEGDGRAPTTYLGVGNILGYVFAARCGHVSDISSIAHSTLERIVCKIREKETLDVAQESLHDRPLDVTVHHRLVNIIREYIAKHCEAILQQSSRPANLCDALSGRSRLSVTNHDHDDSKSSSENDSRNLQMMGRADVRSSNNTILTDEEKEDREERYERTVILTLRAMTLLLNEYAETISIGERYQHSPNETYYSAFFILPSILWKHIGSHRASFRRETYYVMASVFRNGCSLIHQYGRESSTDTEKISSHQSKLLDSLTQAIASERDTGNFEPLFEMNLLYITMSKSLYESDAGKRFSNKIDLLIKTLCKPLRQACYGSPAVRWAPIILPIVASLTNVNIQLGIIKSLWDGREIASSSDAMAIVNAVAETSTYLLLMNSDTQSSEVFPVEIKVSDSDEQQLNRMASQFLIDTIHYYLYSTSTGFAINEATFTLQKTLGRVLFKLDSIAQDTSVRFSKIRHYFWSEGIPEIFEKSSVKDSAVMKLCQLFHEICSYSESKGLSEWEKNSNFRPILRGMFESVVTRRQIELISNEEIHLIDRIFSFCGAGFILNDGIDAVSDMSSSEIERFTMNHLLSWTVNSLSSPSICSGKSVVNSLYSILSHVILSLDSAIDRKRLWETFLKEVIKAGCSIALLEAGLTVVLQVCDRILDTTSNFVICDTLDSLAVDVGLSLSQSCGEEVKHGSFSGINSVDDMARFLCTCIGLESGKIVVTLTVVKKLTDFVLEYNKEKAMLSSDLNVMLDILLRTSEIPSLMTSSETEALLLTAWRQGGSSWYITGRKLLINNPQVLLPSFKKDVFTELRRTLLLNISPLSAIDYSSFNWSQRAWRMYELHQKNYNNESQEFATLSGLCSPSTWASIYDNSMMEQNRSYLFLCLIYFLENFEDSIDRVRFISGQDFAHEGLAAILIGLSSPSPFPYWSHKVTSLPKLLFSTLEASRHLTNSFLESCALNIAESLCKMLQVHQYAAASGALTAFDFVLDILLGKVLFEANLNHKSSQCSRVRDDGVALDASDTFIDSIESTVTEKVLQMYLTPPFRNEAYLEAEASAECFNVIVSRCGLCKMSGIGSRKYELIKMASMIRMCVNNGLQEEMIDATTCSSLKLLSLVMGFGIMVAPSKYNNQVLKIDSSSILESIEKYLDKHYDIRSHFIKHILMFDSAALLDSNVSSEPLVNISWKILDKVSTIILNTTYNTEEKLYLSLLLLRTIEQIRVYPSFNTDANTSEIRVTSNVILICLRCKHYVHHEESFGKYAKNANTSFTFESKNLLQDPFRTFVVSSIQLSNHLIESAANDCIEEIYSHLHSVHRWSVFYILSIVARSTRKLARSNTAILSDTTTSRRAKWTMDLNQEETEELEEDVLVSATWLPQSLMSDIESWTDDMDETSDDDAHTERMLGWLLCLEFLDHASRDDIRNRSHISSYLEKTGALNVVMNLALSYTNLQEKEGNGWFECTTQCRETCSISQLAMFTVFRTIESIPTLIKIWWNESCPKFWQSNISKFVESRVAPETLKRELDRIKKAPNVADLVVSGSCISREVTAIYRQDECQLSVLIRVPAMFPLRNVEVDCRKTLGVSEKRWRHWSLQIMRMLNSQDGSILDALLLWKQNVDKEFEGVEPCPVCYSVLSVKTHSMPNLECKTCHNRFHTQCLYKWFQSSGKNQCVLCQQPWSGSKIA